MNPKRIVITSVAVAIAVVMAGCGEDDTNAGGTSSPSPIVTTTAPTPSPASPGSNKFGDTVAFDNDTSTITLYSYKHNATKFGTPSDSSYVYGAIDLKYCLKAVPGGYSGVSIGSSPWVLKFGDRSFKSTGEYGGNAMKPEYPERVTIKIGTCVRGWLEFKVPKNGKLTEVQYSPQGATEPITWTP